MQKLCKETVQALTLLYGNTAACAASPDMTLLWSANDRAAALFRVLLAQLPGIGAPARPLFPPDRTVLLSGVFPPVVCRVQEIAGTESPLLLLLFSEVQERCSTDLPELRALMRQHIDLNDRAVSEILGALSEGEHARGAERAAAVREIRLACCTLLHQQYCEEELLWYELPDESIPALLMPVSVTDILRQFLAGIRAQTGDIFTADAVEIAENLTARTEPNRLLFVLLSLFTEAQQGNPARTHFRLTAAQNGDRICISLTFSGDSDDGAAGLFRQYAETDGSVLNEQNLRLHFCRLFGAEIKPVQTDSADGFLLELPAESRMPETLTFHAPEPAPPNGPDSKYAVMLSRVLDIPAV